MTNKKRAKDLQLVKDTTISGKQKFAYTDAEGKENNFVALFRSRKARRANARLKGANWRELNDYDKLSY